jgi:hypothetical protein
MLATSLVALIFALVLVIVGNNFQEDVFSPLSKIFACLSWLVSVLAAPIILKTLLLLIPFIWLQSDLKEL